MSKICYSCGEEKDEKLFKLCYKKGKKYLTPTNKCLACTKLDNDNYRKLNQELYNKASRDRRNSRKLRAIEYKGGVCAICGGSFHSAAMDFHHIDPAEKDRDPGLMMGLSDDKLFKELDKCLLLCSNCHRIFHYENGY